MSSTSPTADPSLAPDPPDPTEVVAYLNAHEGKDLLRLVTIGSVDDGKSTLIGRLLFDTGGVYEDQLGEAARASGPGAAEPDLALLTDGLKAEREQGITIDVAYRYFSTDNRKFILADTPGHVQYTRNMATGASTANLAIILVDARLGVQPQTRRHAHIASLLGIPHLLVAVNKMDAIGWTEEVYDAIRADLGGFTEDLDFVDVRYVPVSALQGDNVARGSDEMGWYSGPSVLELLETTPITDVLNLKTFRFPVQCVIRPDQTYRGYGGQVASGVVRPGDEVVALPSGLRSRIASVDTMDGPLDEAFAPMSVTLTLEDEIDISRGDMLVHAGDEPTQTEAFEADLVWMSDRPLQTGRAYLIKHTSRYVRGEIRRVAWRYDADTLGALQADRLVLNDIGRVAVVTHQPLYHDPYRENRMCGAFIVVDPASNFTVGAGVIRPSGEAASGAGLTTSDRPRSTLSSEERREFLGQSGATVWLTGLLDSGKAALAYALERRLVQQGRFVVVVDPFDGQHDDLPDGGHIPGRTAEWAQRLTDAGAIVVFTYISPSRGGRRAVRARVGEERFLQVTTVPSDDPSLNAAGAYDVPKQSALTVCVDDLGPDEAAGKVEEELRRRGLLS